MEPAAQRSRYAFVDALRGVAAMGVVCLHFHRIFALSGYVPDALVSWMRFGDCGVQIFFVISGFVIAHSLRDLRITGSSALNFIVRRQIRLDPLYWTCLLAIAVGCPAEIPAPPSAPSGPGIFLDALYLPGLLHMPFTLDVAWTLALEIQFYLFFLIVLSCVQAAGGTRPMRVAAVCLPAIVSLWLSSDLAINHQPIFLYSWYLFALGVLAYWAMTGAIGRSWFFAMLALTIVVAVTNDWNLYALTGVTAATSLFAVGSAGKLADWTGGRDLQFLGRISYSLYLCHMLVGSSLLVLSRRLLSPHTASRCHLALFVAAVFASIVIATALHYLVERPTMLLSTRMKIGRRVQRTTENRFAPAVDSSLGLARSLNALLSAAFANARSASQSFSRTRA